MPPKHLCRGKKRFFAVVKALGGLKNATAQNDGMDCPLWLEFHEEGMLFRNILARRGRIV